MDYSHGSNRREMKLIRRNLEALTIVFIIFKLLDLIQWSWWLVLAPAWASIALVLFLLLVKWVWFKEEERPEYFGNGAIFENT